MHELSGCIILKYYIIKSQIHSKNKQEYNIIAGACSDCTSCNYVFPAYFPFTDLESREVLAKKNIVRIVTGDFPRFFAIISRLRLDISNIGAEGGLLRSKVDPRIQAVIPEGALTKTIKVGLQVIKIAF